MRKYERKVLQDSVRIGNNSNTFSDFWKYIHKIIACQPLGEVCVRIQFVCFFLGNPRNMSRSVCMFSRQLQIVICNFWNFLLIIAEYLRNVDVNINFWFSWQSTKVSIQCSKRERQGRTKKLGPSEDRKYDSDVPIRPKLTQVWIQFVIYQFTCVFFL